MIKRNKKACGASKRYGLYQAKASGDAKAYIEIERAWFEHWGIGACGVSPMAQFDESHAIWVKNGREC